MFSKTNIVWTGGMILAVIISVVLGTLLFIGGLLALAVAWSLANAMLSVLMHPAVGIAVAFLIIGIGYLALRYASKSLKGSKGSIRHR